MTQTSAPAVPIRPGDRSEEVADVQARLRALGYVVDDEAGHYGSSTLAAVRAFQQARAILVDGLVGPHTWRQLVEAGWRLGDRTLYVRRPLMRGDDVAELQSRLSALGFDAGKPDGIFGSQTAAAVKAFQHEYGVAEDGIWGPASYSALLGLRVDRPGTSSRLREELKRDQAALSGALIVVDPGHGLEDANEAHICWELSVGVAERLVAHSARVRFTRTEAEDIAGVDRAKRANEMDADVFLSLRLNSHEEITAEGASTYFFGGSSAGELLADSIQRRLVALGSRDCRTHARSYEVLIETRMPAVLIEPAFKTNPDDLKRIEDPEFRWTMAGAIADGVADYFRQTL